MYRVLIVDDEYLSRFVLKTIISKNIKSLEICGEAENGRQAVEKNRSLRPDIIIMDIKMPGINGIDATKEILEEFADVSVLILTAYDHFDYIKRALDLGVKGYILKPVREEEVIEKVGKVIKDIDERARKPDFNEQVENKINAIRPLIEVELISSIISGCSDIEKVESYINFLQAEIRCGYFMLISPGQAFLREMDEPVRSRILKDNIACIAENHLPLMKKCYFGSCIGNNITVFFPTEDSDPASETCREAISIGNEIKSRIKVMANVNVAVGIGRIYSGVQNLNRSYNEANFALKRADREKIVVHYQSLDRDDLPEQGMDYPVEMENKLVDLMRIGDMPAAAELAEDIIACVIGGSSKIGDKKEALSELITVIKRTAARSGISFNASGASEDIWELGSLTDLKTMDLWCRRAVHNLLDGVDGRPGRNREVIGRVFEYINRHFTRDITLESVAADAGISPQYLSKIFKEKYGSNFIDYITKKRVELAGELLSRKDASIKDISDTVGYGDSSYFCKIFKKETGFTPKQYRLSKVTGETK